mmetsp:Transcript_16238/g.44965  ORF Transcript_16238/g.44965 Transcript_16238/m.44965 type:complete len:240 (-) Transcript_16238:433-1152(-)
MPQCLDNRKVGILEPVVFSNQTYLHRICPRFHLIGDVGPVTEIRFAGGLDSQVLIDHFVEFLLLQQERYLVDISNVVNTKNTIARNMAEIAYFLSGGHFELFFTTAKDHRGCQSKRPQIFDAMLGRFCFLFVRQNRNETDEGKEEILCADSELKLSQGLQKHTRFDIPHCSANLDETNIRLFPAVISGNPSSSFYPVLDLVCDVGDDLNRLPQIISFSLFQNNVTIHLSGGNVMVLGQL